MYPVLRLGVAALLMGAAVGLMPEPAVAEAPVSVVLVHGAFENSSAWDKVIADLQHRGVRVTAVQNPLTSLSADAENTRRVIDDQPGEVVLVGHSYGGVVITEAGNDPKVKALVYVAGASPDSGQSGLDEASAYPKPALLSHLKVDSKGMAYATAEGMLDLAQDIPPAARRVLQATQGPIALSAFSGKVSKAAWRAKPSWSVVADQDHAVSPKEETDSAARLKAKTLHLRSGHEVMLTQPDAVAGVILEAYRSASASE